MLSRFREFLRRLPISGGQLAFGATLGLVVGLTVLALTGFSFSAPHAAPAQAAARPQPAALVAQPIADEGEALIRLQDLSPEAARIWNASNPVSDLPNPAAKPFLLKAEGVIDEARAVDCMTAAIYYEAAYETTDGQRAVAQVVLNRMRHPAYPKTVCGVVFQGSERATGCQFTFTCDGALARKPTAEGWDRARKVAVAALNGYVMKKVGNATHYHADYVAPYWSPNLVKVGTIGAHIFYRWTGTWGLPPAFAGRYAGGESLGVQLAKLDIIAQEQARLSLVSDDTAPAAAPEAPAHVEEASAVVAVQEAEAELVTAAEAAPADPKTILPPEQLDWQGRPRQKGPPRIAIPSAGGPPKF
ncbi:cell wall hydrolase [Phenylobacterium sp. J367]|uniref:cell wall hydrolase n=1 Tax=Phenylobacterium sp. J367 TaxID=2898435 RepID=UPI00215139A2|nr:cell wall hydrolase [Phenylobacterium sp. J367]MCR5878271.1 cell wall hydrolase [Phenylobacterium sp. J367]